MSKTCKTCGQSKNEIEFDANGYDAYGKPRLRCACKACEKKRRAVRYQQNKGYFAIWRARNKDKVAASNRRQYLKRQGVAVLYQRPTGPRPGRKGIGHYREYQRRRKDYLYVKRKEWEARNIEAVRARMAAWRVKNRERINEQRRRRRLENPEAVRAEIHRRRGAKLDRCGRFKAEQIQQLLVDQHHLCAAPHCRADLRAAKRHLDHKIPLARGGTNDIENLQWLCSRCNMVKNRKTMDEWLSWIAWIMRVKVEAACHEPR